MLRQSPHAAQPSPVLNKHSPQVHTVGHESFSPLVGIEKPNSVRGEPCSVGVVLFSMGEKCQGDARVQRVELPGITAAAFSEKWKIAKNLPYHVLVVYV